MSDAKRNNAMQTAVSRAQAKPVESNHATRAHAKSISAAAASVPFHGWIEHVRSYVFRHADTLKWRVPLALLILFLLHRRIARTRAALFAARPASFWADSFHPPHDAPARSLPPLNGTHLIYSLIPTRVQHALRERSQTGQPSWPVPSSSHGDRDPCGA
jgi:hypothetical protein